ncbi:hypothetical protein GY45DRAFT_461774 [Cubamyces sp. BRFM 1775]|nr:hypothetical protein GY45DRAFT_461774 [Cubamyces sp. BRFM 1775]
MKKSTDIEHIFMELATGSEGLAQGCIRDESLALWRCPPLKEGDDLIAVWEAVWEPLRLFFGEHGYTLWQHDIGHILTPLEDNEDLLLRHNGGFAYVTAHRGVDSPTGSLEELLTFERLNPLCRPARTAGGVDVVIRVLAIGEQGNEHVEILRTVSTGPCAFYNNNHSIPVMNFLQFQDITFGIFPKVGFRVEDAYRYWANNSVGDVLDMILQCLEALTFIHSINIAHRDAFKDNFLVQWHPESMTAGHMPWSRPRVFLTDFEVAVMFPKDAPSEQCRISGYPIGGSYPDDVKQYSRAVPPEVTSGDLYDPFKLDTWQLGTSLKDLKTTFVEIDKVLEDMRTPDAASRPSSFQALSRLSRGMAGLPPKALRIEPEVDRSFLFGVAERGIPT